MNPVENRTTFCLPYVKVGIAESACGDYDRAKVELFHQASDGADVGVCNAGDTLRVLVRDDRADEVGVVHIAPAVRGVNVRRIHLDRFGRVD